MSKFNIVLVHPDIPGNTGSIGRTCVALGARLILIRPYGFDLSEKAVRRAGLDYWKHVELTEYDDFAQFLKSENPEKNQLHLFSRFATDSYFDHQYNEDCYLIFGSETKGLPQEVMNEFQERLCSLPMYSEHIRSLNLSNAVTAAAYEVIRNIK